MVYVPEVVKFAVAVFGPMPKYGVSNVKPATAAGFTPSAVRNYLLRTAVLLGVGSSGSATIVYVVGVVSN